MWSNDQADVPAPYILNVFGLYVKDPCDLNWCGKQLPPGTPE